MTFVTWNVEWKNLKTQIEWRNGTEIVRAWVDMKKGMEIDSRKINVIVVQIAAFYLHFLLGHKQQQMHEWMNE